MVYQNPRKHRRLPIRPPIPEFLAQVQESAIYQAYTGDIRLSDAAHLLDCTPEQLEAKIIKTYGSLNPKQ